jgi:type III secretion system low calcium response chaperone LcrH/SycD
MNSGTSLKEGQGASVMHESGGQGAGQQAPIDQADDERRVLAVLEAGGTLKDVAGLTRADVETAYVVGVGMLDQAKYGKAEPLLQFACMYEHTEPRYWMALGRCRQALKNYRGAINAYVAGHAWDDSDPMPVVQAAVCYLALGDKDGAREALALADKIELATPDEALRQRITALRQAL